MYAPLVFWLAILCGRPYSSEDTSPNLARWPCNSALKWYQAYSHHLDRSEWISSCCTGPRVIVWLAAVDICQTPSWYLPNSSNENTIAQNCFHATKNRKTNWNEGFLWKNKLFENLEKLLLRLNIIRIGLKSRLKWKICILNTILWRILHFNFSAMVLFFLALIA